MIKMVVVLGVKKRTFALVVVAQARRKTDLLVQPVMAMEIVSFVIPGKRRWLNKTAFFLDKNKGI